MDDFYNVTFSRSQLESLSTGELIKLAESVDIDIPPDLQRIFIIEELLEYSAADKPETGDEIEINPSYSESVALPKQYNISFVDVIIRDPLWVYVFWEIKGHDREIHENAADFNGYVLRVIPMNRGDTAPESKENSFTVTINADDSSRYLGFTEQSLQDEKSYIIVIAAVRGDTEIQIAVSAPFSLPKLVLNIDDGVIEQNPLLRLSGIQELATIKSMDRQSRLKG
ncbi:MAG: DUF4912 domain-containing protein [Treponema sp.]|jgi:hypothetical protein|nr:DUF4912 domain-containing protein [Treponema sp.]